MSKRSNIIFADIKALKLAPHEVLVVHLKQPTEESRKALRDELTKALWGMPNKVLVLEGNYEVGKTTITPAPCNLHTQSNKE